jgi:hypothetical protein
MNIYVQADFFFSPAVVSVSTEIARIVLENVHVLYTYASQSTRRHLGVIHKRNGDVWYIEKFLYWS